MSSQSSPRFLINAKNYFLTYARCPISKDIVLIELKSLGFPINWVFIRVCEESHTDGAQHLHCLIQFSGKYKCRNSRFFDIVDRNTGEVYHPNVQSAGSADDVADYIAKGGIYVEEGEFRADGRKRRRDKTDLDEEYTRALNARTKEESIAIIKRCDPRTYALQRHNIIANMEKEFAPPVQEYAPEFNPESFQVPEQLSIWVRENIRDINDRPHRPKSLILEGESRLGKTAWARSLGPHNYVMGFMDFNCKTFSNKTWYNVIDDVTPSYLQKKHWKELIGAQRDWQSNAKYGKPIQIKGGIPCIVLCNPGESSYRDFLQLDCNYGLNLWTIANAEFFIADTPFYRSEASPMQTEEASSHQA
nr:replication-associated protein [Fraxinus symptomless virus]